MRGVSARTLGPIPYAASVEATAALPFVIYPSTAATTLESGISTGLYAEVGKYDLTFFRSSPVRTSSSSDFVENLALYTMDRSFPELIPDMLVNILPEDSYQPYEPFIASEAWREVPAPSGPFVVEYEDAPAAHFDAYDLSTIALYEQE